MGYLTSGNAIVDRVGTINITGNIIPAIWYKTILKDSGKPYLLAIAILADIVYWYRPTEVRDRGTGQVSGWKKKFSEDILRQSYQYYADLFGELKKTVKMAMDRLEELAVVKRHFRTVSYGDGLVSNNVMYVELIPERLYELTYPEEEPGKAGNGKAGAAGGGDRMGGRLPAKPDPPVEKTGGRGIPNGRDLSPVQDTGGYEKVQSLYPKPEGGDAQTGYTYSENTAQNPFGDFYPVNPSAPEEETETDGYDEASSCMELIRENIEYGHHMKYDSYGDRELYDELYQVICEVVCVRHESVRIGGEKYPYELVRAKFLKLNSSHLQYVMSSMRDTSAKITNIKAYMITALYNAPSTMQARRVRGYYIRGLDFTRIAKEEGVDKSVVNRSVHRGLKCMREYYSRQQME